MGVFVRLGQMAPAINKAVAGFLPTTASIALSLPVAEGAGITTLGLGGGTRAAAAGAAEAGELAVSAHGALRVADASRLTLEASADVIANATRVGVQRDGASVFIQAVGGRYNVVVMGERGLVTNLKTISEKSLMRLAKRYGWTFPK
ncbi:MAG TPA: hypothetical protein VFS11_11380 [Gemmatimonadales bacterium]|nr:hypothetical protein [Gemmatimonadales bacterium]